MKLWARTSVLIEMWEIVNIWVHMDNLSTKDIFVSEHHVFFSVECIVLLFKMNLENLVFSKCFIIVLYYNQSHLLKEEVK